MARKGTIKNMGKVQREMSAAWKARKDAKATATPGDTTPPTREEALAVADANLARIEADAGATTPATPEPAAATPKDPKPAGRAPRARKPKAEAGSKKASGLDLAARVLAEAGEPLAARAIAERAIAAGWQTNGKTPEATLYAAIIREIAAKGDAARFRKTDRGLFAATGKAA